MGRSTLVLFAIVALVVAVTLGLRSRNEETSQYTEQASTTIVTTTTSTAAPASPTTSTVPTTLLPVGVEVCDLYTNVTSAGRIASETVVEASGLAASRTTTGVLWTHNDSRGAPALYAFSRSGDDLGEYGVPGAFAFDWEDMSAGPGPDGEGNYLYVGDIGDNLDIRAGLITVYRVEDIDPGALDGEFPSSTALVYRYPDGSHNAEALFVDPIEPALYLITKDHDVALVYKGSLDPTEGTTELELAAELPVGAEVTSADMSFDGSTLVLRGYKEVWMWHRDANVSIAEMLTESPCSSPSPDEHQGEAIAFDENQAYWTVSEGSQSPIQVVERDTTE